MKQNKTNQDESNQNESNQNEQLFGSYSVMSYIFIKNSFKPL